MKNTSNNGENGYDKKSGQRTRTKDADKEGGRRKPHSVNIADAVKILLTTSRALVPSASLLGNKTETER